MRTITINNKVIELDLYGRVPGAAVETELSASIGLLQCTLSPIEFEDQLVIEADLWQCQKGGAQEITNFRAGVMMRREGDRYRIIDKSFRDYNDLWRELEVLISNAIMVNT